MYFGVSENSLVCLFIIKLSSNYLRFSSGVIQLIHILLSFLLSIYMDQDRTWDLHTAVVSKIRLNVDGGEREGGREGGREREGTRNFLFCSHSAASDDASRSIQPMFSFQIRSHARPTFGSRLAHTFGSLERGMVPRTPKCPAHVIAHSVYIQPAFSPCFRFRSGPTFVLRSALVQLSFGSHSVTLSLLLWALLIRFTLSPHSAHAFLSCILRTLIRSSASANTHISLAHVNRPAFIRFLLVLSSLTCSCGQGHRKGEGAGLGELRSMGNAMLPPNSASSLHAPI